MVYFFVLHWLLCFCLLLHSASVVSVYFLYTLCRPVDLYSNLWTSVHYL